MKKVINFIGNSIFLFGTYIIAAFLIMLILQVPMRIFIDAESQLEYLWKALVQYAVMVAVCVVFLLVRNTEHKVVYLKHIENGEWNLRDACVYVIKNKYFWINTAGFAVWPILVPKLFGAINLFYASKDFLSSFPISILVIFTVDLPFVVFSFIAWLIVTRYWSKTRMHRAQNDHKN